MRRFQNQLYLMSPLVTEHADIEVQLDGAEQLRLPTGSLLTWQTTDKKAIPESWLSQLTLRFRRGGERIKLTGQTHHSQLKHLMQQWQVPPWQRGQIPLLFRGDELVAVVGFAQAETGDHSSAERQWLPVLQPHD